MIAVTPPPPWWRWPLIATALAMLVAGWIWQRTKATPLVGTLAWQEGGKAKRRELEGTRFDLAALQIAAIPPRKYVLRNLRRTGPFLIDEGHEPRRLEHKEQFEAEGIKFTYLEN